ncbi:rhodanese-like domain-containing protein [Mesoterricola silvestris]|uniref:Phage-shock protein n=1 Tax=Mesoterricola silvestris TaxID=2927979 RepID=A0AA48KAM9_9BACT|nr:rhodanese-like domain-containing protein [Mesoterricola silvestris]BDU73477.1 phage-shock protein [Mesoterricola silvestris]
MPQLSNAEFTLLAALLVGLAWFILLRNRNRTPPLTQQQVAELRQRGALLLDVRSPGEFSQGHPKGARNIPLPELPQRLGDLDPKKPVLTCCASGVRSASARRLLLKAGFQEVHDVGPWTVLKP